MQFPPLLHVRASDGREMITLESMLSTLGEDMEVLERRPPAITPATPCALLIKPTFGSFRNYSSTCLLHAGVSDSEGRVYNFDQDGHHVQTWEEAICVPVECDDPEAWDAALIGFDLNHQDTGVPYSERGYNCYNYVVDFLNSIQYLGKTNHSVESVELEVLGKPALHAVNEYVLYWQKLQDQPSVPVAHSCDACHVGVCCDGCGKGVCGSRFKCGHCPDYDLCGDCVKSNEHDQGHSFREMPNPDPR
eukprot:TRINITY_DN5877_c0_g1_i1.p1 TRINITY_DN5877_c0_g1~~TRINITY_DN5877_c0_g1_i1.p1  ORF type:complete len:248 (-),score=66.36 TRINITY_DN5877_c0_g1_i1:256-999(-)